MNICIVLCSTTARYRQVQQAWDNNVMVHEPLNIVSVGQLVTEYRITPHEVRRLLARCGARPAMRINGLEYFDAEQVRAVLARETEHTERNE